MLRPRRSRNTGLARVGLLLTLVGLVAIALLTDCTTEKPKGFGLQSERCEFVGWRLPPDSSQIIDFSVDDSSREAVASNRVYLPATQHTLDSIIPKEAIRWCAGPQGHSIRSDW